MMPKVSVIVPCYNQAKYLPVTLESVYLQSLNDWECIIIDDGSPDETKDIAKKWVEKDSRFRYYRKDNGGLSSARNYGIEQAKGKYIQFLDSDDVILPEKLDRQVNQLENSSSYSLSFTDYKRGGLNDIYAPIGGHAPYLPPILDSIPTIYELAGDWETRLSIPPHCFLFSSSFFHDGLRFSEELENHEDWDCWMNIFAQVIDVRYIPEVLSIYRYHADSMCQNYDKMKSGYLKAIEMQIAINKSNIQLMTILRLKKAEISLIYEKIMHKPCVEEKINIVINRISRKLKGLIRKFT
jgi:glycosyltransferase involved in cell wall biosynthesis